MSWRCRTCRWDRGGMVGPKKGATDLNLYKKLRNHRTRALKHEQIGGSLKERRFGNQVPGKSMEVFFVILHEVRYNRVGFPSSFTAAWVKKWIWTQFESKYYEFAGWTVIPSKVAYRLAQQTPSKNQLTEASSTHLGEASFLTNTHYRHMHFSC